MYPRILRQSIKEYDIVHINNAKLATYGLLQPIRPIVLTIWGTDDGQGQFGSLTKKVAPYYDEVIVSGNWMSQRISVDHQVIEFPFDSKKFYPIPQKKARSKIGWDDKGNVILFPYDKTYKLKNYPLAKSITEKADTDAELISISSVPNEEMPYYMNASDVVIVTSKGEPGPGVVKEAALCNVPVVSVDTGFVADALEGVSNSYVCTTEKELVDAIDTVLSSGERSDGRKKASEWSINRMGEQLQQVYQGVLETN
jgi:glycosyltransferase involved in cell wall biosynthesis